MSGYRNFQNPAQHNLRYDPAARALNAAWGWIAAAAFLVVILTVLFGHQQIGTNTASNDVTPPAAMQMMPPITNTSPSTRPTPLSTTPAPITPTPNSPAQHGQ